MALLRPCFSLMISYFYFYVYMSILCMKRMHTPIVLCFINRCTAGYEFAGVDPSTRKVICQPAPLGVYKDSLGNIKGVSCPPGSNTLSNASTSLADCVCSAGYYLEEDSRVCQVSHDQDMRPLGLVHGLCLLVAGTSWQDLFA